MKMPSAKTFLQAYCLVECLTSWICLIFSHDWVQIKHFWQEYNFKVIVYFLAHHFKRNMSVCPNITDVEFDRLVKVVMPVLSITKVLSPPGH